MPEISELYAALENADAAGDKDSAREIASMISMMQGSATATKKEKPDTGFTGALKSGIENVKGAGYAFAGRTGLMNPEEAEKEIAKHKLRASEVFQPTQESWTQAPITKIKELAGGSFPYIAAPIAGAALGAVAGPAAVAGVSGATIGSLLAGAAQYTGTGLQRQMDEGKKLADTNLLAAGAAAVPSAILDRVSFGMIPGIRQIFGAAGKEISESVAQKLAEKGLMSTVGSYALASGKAMGTEGVTETAQQFLERLQAGLSLTDKKARDEYFDSFIGGAVLGGTLAIPGKFYERNIAKEPPKAPPTTEGNLPPIPPSGTEQSNAPLLLAPPLERYVPPETKDPLLNPLGTFTSADLSPKEITHINSLRKEAGKPRLPHAFSIEDIADSNPPEGVMERLIAHRTGYTGEVTKPQTVLNIAAQRGIDTATPGFKDFLMRATGSSDLATMTPPQLFAAAKAMENVQRGEDLNILQAGISNARHYTADQYNDAVDAADSAFKQYGKNQPLGRGEMLKTIGKATGLTNQNDQARILERAVAEGHLERIVTGMKDKSTGETRPVESFKPATGLTPLPGGLDIREEMFKQGEQPAGYEVVAGNQTISPHATEEEAVAAANLHQNDRMIVAQKIQNQINGYQTAINSRNEDLRQMQSVGQGTTHEFFTKSADYYAKNQLVQQNIDKLKQEQAEYLQPVGIKPMGMKPVVSKQHTLYEKGQEVGRFESPYQAEEFGISRLSDKMLQRIVDSAAAQTQTGRVKRYADMARNELYRRKEAIEAGTESYIKTKQGIQGAEERLAKLGIYSNATKDKIDAIHKNLYSALKKFGLEKVGLRIVHSIEDGRADGTYVKSLITVAMDSESPMGTLRHEVIHALKELGAFTAQEWRILTNKAKTEWVNKYLPKQLQEAYKAQYLQENGNLRGFDEYLQEEAIAEAFKHFATEKPPAGFFANMFMRLKNFFEVLKSAFNKAGLPTSEAIFKGIEEGAYAPEMRQAREEARQAARPKYDVRRLNMTFKQVTERIPELQEAAKKVKAGTMTAKQYDKLVNKYKPILPYDFVPQPASKEEAIAALGSKAEKEGVWNADIPKGHPVDLRLDINAYKFHGVWVNSIHNAGLEAGFPRTSYSNVSAVNNAKFIVPQEVMLDVATGEKNKTPQAVINGGWQKMSPKQAVDLMNKHLNDPAWAQVGMDPDRHGYFYDRKTTEPIVSADQVIQIGPLVLAKNPVYAPKAQFKYSFSNRSYKLDIDREKRKLAKTASLNDDERAAILKDAQALGLNESQIDIAIKDIVDNKKRYPKTQGWAELIVKGIKTKTNENGTVKVFPAYQKIQYGYNSQDIDKVVVKFQNEITKLYARAKAGDKNAQDIIAHQHWYKNVATTLRREYGGFGDLLSDLLGATSPNTPVDTNWKFSVDILERFVRGEFHKEMEAFTKYVDKGGRVSDFPDVDKIRQLSTKLYGMNSINAMKALADMWKGIEAGQAPKAKNFAANLIGKSNMATIDVWAARMLRRSANMISGADLPRIPPPAEKGVTGSWNTKATAVTGEYGFGAEVLDKVSQNLRKKGIALDPPDLQAIAWFAEKELWGKKNWTTKVGEGGSFEENIEANPVQRYLSGISAQQGKVAPSKENIERVKNAIESTLSKDSAILAFRAKETKGLYGDEIEQSFDTEWVAKQGYDPTDIVSTLAQQAKNNEQYDIIVSKVINPTEANANARPGVEIYFMNQKAMDDVIPVLEKFTSKGQDGFTLVVDPRSQKDQYMGVRLQYCPEISMRWDEDLRKQLLTPEGLESVIAEKYLALYKIAAEVSAMPGIAHAKMVNYDSIVIGKENYDNYISTTDRTGSPQAGERVWFGQPIREHVETAVRRYSEPEGGNTGTVEQPSGEKYSLRAPDTAEFKQFFKNSKVVDEDGKPLLMYHSTKSEEDFDTFDTNRSSYGGTGSWFSREPYNTFIAGQERGRIIPAFLSLKNPAYEDLPAGDAFNKKKLMEQGYDGVLFVDPRDKHIITAVAFKPEQIKSVFNKEPVSSGQKFSLALGKLEPTTFLVSDKNPNNTGNLAYMPDAAPFPQLPIRLPVGIHNEDTNGGYGANHILRRAKTDISHRPVAVTKESLEDTILQLQKIGKEFKRIYRSGPNLVLYDPTTDDAMFVLPRTDHYEVQTMYSSKDIGRRFGDAIWSGRNTQPPEPMGFTEKQQGISVKASPEGRVVPTNVAAVTTAYKRPVMTPTNVEAVADIPETPRIKGTLGVKRSLRGMVPQDIEDAVNRTTTGRDERGFVERMMDAISPNSFTKIRQNLIFGQESIEKLGHRVAKEFGNERYKAEVSAIAAVLQAHRAAGVAASSFRDGIPVFRKGYTYVSNEDGKVKGLIATLEPLMKYDDPKIFQYFQFYAGTVRGKRLMENGREKTFTPEDIKRGQELAKMFPEFPEVFREYQIYNQGLVQYMKDTGVISDAEAKTWTENWDYIPFYRQMDGEDTIGPKVFSSIAGVSKPKALKGSEYFAVVDTEGKEIARYLDANRANAEAAKIGASVEKRGVELADFIETVVRNARAAIEAGMKNEAGRRTIRDTLDVGLGEKVPVGTTGSDIVTIKEKGETVYYRVADPLLIEALKGLNLPQLPFLNILAAPANLLRNFVTKDPGFIIANLGRDSVQAWITSGIGMTPLVDTFKQFGKTLANQSPEANALARAGLTGYDFAGDVKSTARQVEKELRKRSGKRTATETALLPLTSFWEMLDHGSHASDMATRAEVYKRTLERTGSEAEALYQAMEVLNFSRKGNSAVIRIMSAMVPFFNARVQGLDVLYRSGWGKMAMENKEAIQKAFMFRSLTLLGLSVMYWAAVSDDDEYKKLTKEERDNYWIAPGFEINGKPFRFPIPFELGVVFKVIPERILEYNFGTDTGKDLRESLMRNAMSTLSFNPIPQAVLPVVENIANYSFFTGDPIVSQGLAGIDAKYQVNQSTSQLAQKLASGINSELPKDMQISPIKLDNFIRGYTGTMGTYATMLIDSALTGEGDPIKATKRLEQLPVIKRFFATDTGTIAAFYDLKNEVETTVRTVNNLNRSGNQEELREYLKENRTLYGLKNYVNVIDKNMQQLNNMTKIINQSKTMDADEKRVALDKIHDAQVKLTERVRILKKQYE